MTRPLRRASSAPAAAERPRTGLALVPIALGGTRAGYEIEHPLTLVLAGFDGRTRRAVRIVAGGLI